jgi:catechol 2,3-dioxygenase-like lactoylglutathione lyase family enzyme
MTIAHTGLPVSNYKKSKAFYTKVLGAVGYKQNMEYGEAAGFNDGKNTDFWIWKYKKSFPPMHVAFAFKNKAAVKKFYDAALKSGAKDNGAPGYRKSYWYGYYAALIYDPDGHNVEAVFFDYKAPKK